MEFKSMPTKFLDGRWKFEHVHLICGLLMVIFIYFRMLNPIQRDFAVRTSQSMQIACMVISIATNLIAKTTIQSVWLLSIWMAILRQAPPPMERVTKYRGNYFWIFTNIFTQSIFNFGSWIFNGMDFHLVFSRVGDSPIPGEKQLLFLFLITQNNAKYMFF